MTRYAPPAATIARELGLDDAAARKIRAAWKAGDFDELEAVDPGLFAELSSCFRHTAFWPRFHEFRREFIDTLGEFHGVEYLGHHKRLGASVYYCNSGDTYAATLWFCGEHMRLGCWGDLVERGLVERGSF